MRARFQQLAHNRITTLQAAVVSRAPVLGNHVFSDHKLSPQTSRVYDGFHFTDDPFVGSR